jgi:hypothetical protein
MNRQDQHVGDDLSCSEKNEDEYCPVLSTVGVQSKNRLELNLALLDEKSNAVAQDLPREETVLKAKTTIKIKRKYFSNVKS